MDKWFHRETWSAMIILKIMLKEIEINNFLQTLCEKLEKHKSEIIQANNLDINESRMLCKDDAFIERLTVSEKTFAGMLVSLKEIISQPSPIGNVLKEWEVPHNGLKIKRVTCPIGRILIIYESRPNVTLDAFALCFKSGNSCILRGGSESFNTSSKIVEVIHKTFDDMGLGHLKSLVEYIQTKDRTAIVDLLQKSDEIDLVIPRGGKGLVEFVANNTKIPILKHLDGNCHTYIENTANASEAISTLRNAKLRRVSICGATESLVLDEGFAKKHLTAIVDAMPECEFVGCEQSRILDSRIKPATEEDYYTEYLKAKLSVKIVNNVDEAIKFINQYSSGHTEAIFSENMQAVQKFQEQIDSAIVMHNVSTQFADGYEFGFGGEIGIATGKLHARGPVALNELVTYKNIVYSGEKNYLKRK